MSAELTEALETTEIIMLNIDNEILPAIRKNIKIIENYKETLTVEGEFTLDWLTQSVNGIQKIVDSYKNFLSEFIEGV